MKRLADLVSSYLDPATRLGEILFGLIMVLTITSTSGLIVSEGPEGMRQLLIAALGCNIAWGIIDGAMYVMTQLFERSRRYRLALSIQRAPDEHSALALIHAEIGPSLESVAEPAELERLYRSIARRLGSMEVPSPKVVRADLLGAAACFLLVFISCLPAALPFLIFDNPPLALRVSNGLLLVMLFIVGWEWARYTSFPRVTAGATFVVGGLLLVGIAILLGG